MFSDFSDTYREALSSSGITRNLSFSAKCGNGKEKLEEVLTELYPGTDKEIRSGLIVTGARQYASLQKAKEHITLAIETLEKLTPDMCCAELENAMQCLLEIDGRGVNEKIVEGIFSHFCVGK